MPRNPIIKKAVLKVLEEFQGSIRFSELKKKVEETLRREIHAEALAAANAALIKDGSIEKMLVSGRITYALSRQFHKQTVKTFLTKLVESFRLEELEANFVWDKERLPSVVCISPAPNDQYEVAERSNLKMSVDVDWREPAQAISSIICNDYLLLPTNIRDGISALLLWSYWITVQEKKRPQKIYDVQMDSMESRLKDCMRYSSESLTKAKERGDNRRIATEEAIITILDITLELLKKENLLDFLQYADEKRDNVKRAEDTILSTHGHFMSSGERVFHNMVYEKNDMVFDGISSLEERVGKAKGLKSILKEPELSMDAKVWNDFIHFLIELYPESFLKNINGSLEDAADKGKQYARYINDLISLARKRQMVAIYLWNVPVKKEAEKYLKLPQFEEWYAALKAGELSHRVWLFEEETVRDVESAYRAAKGGKIPKASKIDKEFWTLRDLYELHPKGKDPEFWYELVTTLKGQRGKEPYRGGPVPKDVYYEFIKREREAVRELIGREKGSQQKRVLLDRDKPKPV
jgi:hypothetical protein